MQVRDMCLAFVNTLSDDGKDYTGSLLIVNVDSRAAAQAFVDGDPFQKAGMFASVSITL